MNKRLNILWLLLIELVGFTFVWYYLIATNSYSSTINNKVVNNVDNNTTQALTASPYGKVATLSSSGIFDSIKQIKGYGRAKMAIEASGLDEDLKSTGAYTIFLPNDDAIEKLPPGTMEELLRPEKKDKLRNFVARHIIKGILAPDDLRNNKELSTINDNKLKLTEKNGQWWINDKLVVSHIYTDQNNGVIYSIDSAIAE